MKVPSRSGLGAVVADLVRTAPSRSSALAQHIALMPAGPLDSELHQFLDAWAQIDEADLVDWLGPLPSHQTCLHAAVAECFAQRDWSDRARLRPYYDAGLHDPDPAVRDVFLSAGHFLLNEDISHATQLLRDSGVSPAVCANLLAQAANYDGYAWGATLDEANAAVILQFTKHVSLVDHLVQQIVAGVASNFPGLVLDHLSGEHDLWRATNGGIAGLSQTLQPHKHVIAEWLIQTAPSLPRSTRQAVFDLAICTFSTAAAAAVAERLENLSSERILALGEVLEDVASWPQQHPGLSRDLLSRAHELGVIDEIQRAVVAAASSFGRSGSSSKELDELYGSLKSVTDVEDDPALRTAFAVALNDLGNTIRQLRRHRDSE